MAVPFYYDFTYYRGDSLTFYVFPIDKEGNPIDLDAYDAVFTIANARGPDPAFSITATAVIDNTRIVCTIPPSVGAQLEGTSYVYDIQVNSGVENVYTYLTGNINVTLDVSEA